MTRFAAVHRDNISPRIEMRTDFQHLGRWRKASGQAQSFTFRAPVAIIVSEFVGVV